MGLVQDDEDLAAASALGHVIFPDIATHVTREGKLQLNLS